MTVSYSFKRFTVGAALCVSLAACGGGGGGNYSGTTTMALPPVSLSGVFVDNAVSGFRYTTTTYDDSADQDGTFIYAEGESVTFAIGDIDFSTVAAASVLSPFDLAGTADTSDTALDFASTTFDADVANLFGTPHTDETLTLTLPQSRTLDELNGISVWCVEARVDFGSGMFAPP